MIKERAVIVIETFSVLFTIKFSVGTLGECEQFSLKDDRF